MGTKVFLNVYDLSPANDVLYNIGFGLHHSGVEILGTEYSFASGAGIFEDRPKEAGGAKFRESIELGAFEGGQAEARTIIGDLRSDFGPDAYNLIRKNCNSFANAFVWALLGRSIPGHVNRLADLGVCCSCLLPKKLLEEAPVGPNAGNNSSSGGGFQPGGPKATMAPAPKAFSGSGATLGSSNSGNANAGGVGGRLLGVIGVGGSAGKGKDDLIDRREKARKAALARFEQSGASPPNSASFSTHTTSSSTSSGNNSSSGFKSS